MSLMTCLGRWGTASSTSLPNKRDIREGEMSSPFQLLAYMDIGMLCNLNSAFDGTFSSK